MVSKWQSEVENKRKQIAEDEAENLELKRRAAVAESTVTHQLNQTDLHQLFAATRDSSLATAHVKYFGKKKISDYAKLFAFRIQNFYFWHLVHQFNNFTQSLLKVEEELIERLSSIEGRLAPTTSDLEVKTTLCDEERLRVMQIIIDSRPSSKDDLPLGVPNNDQTSNNYQSSNNETASNKSQPPNKGAASPRGITPKEISTLIVHDHKLDKVESLQRPWVFFEEVSSAAIDIDDKAINPKNRDISDLAIEISRRFHDRSIYRAVIEESITNPVDLLWIIKLIATKIKFGGELAIVIERDNFKLSPETAIDALTYLEFDGAHLIDASDRYLVVSAKVTTRGDLL